MAADLEVKDWTMGLTAENDLSGKQFYALEIGATGTLDVCDGATDLVVGILQNKPTAGQAVAVRSEGFSKLIAGGAITRGDRVGTTNAGKGVTKTADADNWFGIAHSTSTTDGDIIVVQLCIGSQRSN